MTSRDDFVTRYGPTAVVTGASSGIGHSFATLLAELGLDLVLIARRRDRLETLASTLRAAHAVDVAVHAEDLTDPEAPSRLVEELSSRDVGLVISNAGFGAKGGFEGTEASTLRSMITVNCHAPTRLAHGLVPHLKSRGRGGLVFTSSVEGLLGVPFSAAYSASKAYLNALGEGLWGELDPLGVDVLVLCPGATDTEAPARQGIDTSTLEDLMSPDDVASMALQNLRHGPTYIPSEHYRSSFDALLAMPRRDALRAMADALRG